MKRLKKVLLAFFMVLSFTACSSEQEIKPEKIEMEKENKFNDLVSYQIETIGRPQQIVPDITGNYYTYYKPTKPDNVFIDITMLMTNLQKKELKLTDVLKGSFIIGETEYVASTALVSDDGKSLSQGGSLVSEGKSKVHFYAEVKPSLLNKKIEFKFTSPDEEKPKEASMKFKLSDIVKKYENKNINDTIVFDEYSEIALQGVNLTKKLEPAKPAGLYSFYQVQDENNSFVVLTTTVKNNSSNDLLASNLAVARLIDQDGNEYPANLFYEKDDRTNISSADTVTLNPGKSALVHFVFEVNDSIANGEKTFRISHNGKVFIVNVV